MKPSVVLTILMLGPATASAAAIAVTPQITSGAISLTHAALGTYDVSFSGPDFTMSLHNTGVFRQALLSPGHTFTPSGAVFTSGMTATYQGVSWTAAAFFLRGGAAVEFTLSPVTIPQDAVNGQLVTFPTTGTYTASVTLPAVCHGIGQGGCAPNGDGEFVVMSFSGSVVADVLVKALVTDDGPTTWTVQPFTMVVVDAPVVATPEPASLTLVGLGGLALWSRRRQRPRRPLPAG